MVVLPPAVLIAVLFGFEFPDGLENLLLFLVSAISGIILVFSIHYVFGILAFWFQTAEYVAFFIRACMTLFAGYYIPLWFYPKVLYTICLFLPFRLITFEPIALYLGRTTGLQAIQIIALQWMWIIILSILGALMWKQAQKHIIVQGG